MNTIAASSKSTLNLINDWSAFRDLKPACQSDILLKLDGIRQIYHALKTSAEKKTAVIERISDQRRVGKATIYRELKAYENNGIDGLIDHRRFGQSSGFPPRFESFIKGLFDQHQRADDGKEVYRKLIDRLNTWRITGDPQYSIPGYEAPPENSPRYDHPRSWSYKNILRLRPSKFERINIKRGEKESNSYIPQVLTTRIGSAYLSRIMTDDQDYDNLIDDGTLALAGIKEAQRPVSFNALDFYTACHIGHHMRLEFKEADRKIPGGGIIKGKTKTLTSQEYQWFIIGLMQRLGYRTDDLGTVFVGEWKTAAPWQNKKLSTINGLSSFNDALHLVTGGHVSFERSGLTNKALFAGLYFKPQSTGNFKFKTWIESSFRLLRTYMQALPGNIGSNQRLNGPAELHGIKQKVTQHARAIASHLDPHTASLIRRELLDLPKFYTLVCGVYRALNSRTEHNMEGWSGCGFSTELWRPSPESSHWFEEHELSSIIDPTEKRMLIQRINQNRETLTRTRNLSPEQARQLCEAQDKRIIKKLRDEDVGLLLPWEWSKPVTVRDGHSFSLKNPLSPDTRDTYVAQFKDHRGILTTLPHGLQFHVFANSFGDGRAHLYTDNREYLGTIHPTVRAEPFNAEKVQVQLETRTSVKSALSAQQRARMEDIGRKRTEDAQFNTRLIAGEETDLTARRQQGAERAQITKAEKMESAATDDAFSSIADISEETADTDTIQF